MFYFHGWGIEDKKWEMSELLYNVVQIDDFLILAIQHVMLSQKRVIVVYISFFFDRSNIQVGKLYSINYLITDKNQYDSLIHNEYFYLK